MTTARAFLIAALVLLGTAFGPFLDGDFVWDDVHLIETNAAMQRSDGWRAIATQDLWGQATGASTQLYHPVPMLTLWAQAQLGGVSVWPLRLGNVFIHALASALLALWLRRRGVPAVIAYSAALVLLVHPSVTEPVMWLTGRHDTLAVALVMAGLLCWPEGDGSLHPWRALATGTAFAAAFLCKEPYLVAAVLPFLLTASGAVREGRLPGRTQLIRLALVPVPVGAAVALRLGLGISLGAAQARAPLAEQAQHFAGVVLHYGAQLATFGNGPTIAPYAKVSAATTAWVWAAMLALTLALALAARRSIGQLADAWVGWLWFLAALLPHAVAAPAIGLFGNRYGYFALFGLTTCAAACAASLPVPALPRARMWGVLATLAAATALAFVTGSLASAWRNNLTLYARDLERDPSNGHALYHYATAVLAEGGCEQALPLFIRAAELAPTYPRPLHNAAGCSIETQRPELAIAFARRELRLAPRNAGAHYNLAAGLLATGDLEAGVRHLDAALRLEPQHAAARQLLARVRAGERPPAEAPRP